MSALAAARCTGLSRPDLSPTPVTLTDLPAAFTNNPYQPVSAPFLGSATGPCCAARENHQMFNSTDRPTTDPTTASPTEQPLQSLEAVRAECLRCCNGSLTEVRECPFTACALWSLRMGRRSGDAPRTVGAIRKKCIDCSGGGLAEVRTCQLGTTCPLHRFRMGKNRTEAGRPRSNRQSRINRSSENASGGWELRSTLAIASICKIE